MKKTFPDQEVSAIVIPQHDSYKDQAIELLTELKTIANDRKITHQQIADRAGWQQTHVTRALNARYVPRLEHFLLLASVIGVEIRLEPVPQRAEDRVNRNGKKILKAIRALSAKLWDEGSPQARHTLGMLTDDTLVNILFMHPDTHKDFCRVKGVPANCPPEVSEPIIQIIKGVLS